MHRFNFQIKQQVTTNSIPNLKQANVIESARFKIHESIQCQ